MQKYILWTLFFFSASAFSMLGNDWARTEAVPGEFLVRLSKDFKNLKKNSVKLDKVVSHLRGIYKVKRSDNSSLLKEESALLSQKALDFMFMQRLRDTGLFSYVEPNYVYRIAGDSHSRAFSTALEKALPNDPQFPNLWGMEKIMAPEAWTLTKGSRDVVVAVIDTGIDHEHPDLKNNLWSTEKNGEVIIGYNSIEDNYEPFDGHGHGTHVAGTIGAAGDDGVGVVGVSWNVSLMGVKFLSDAGSGTTENAIKSIDWAVAHGAQLMNNSWGGGAYSEALQESIEDARDKGVLFAAAAGNSSLNNDVIPHYPSNYPVDNVISVAASTEEDTMAGFSCYGRETVHIMAPGKNILSSVPGEEYDSYNGTSMATPHVVGAAALLLSVEPDLNYKQVIERLVKTGDKVISVRRKLANGGPRLNVWNLLNNIQPPGPFEVPEEEWSPRVEEVVESAHPYENNKEQEWVIHHAGASYLRLHFESFNLEANYDFVRIYDEAGDMVDEFTGNLGGDFWSFQIKGDTAVVKFRSDYSITREGFKIDGYEWTSFEAPAE